MDALLAELVRGLPASGGGPDLHARLAAAAAFDKDRRFGPPIPDGTRRQRYERAVRLSAGGPFEAALRDEATPDHGYPLAVLLDAPDVLDLPCGVFPRDTDRSRQRQRHPDPDADAVGDWDGDGDGDGDAAVAGKRKKPPPRAQPPTKQTPQNRRPPAKKATASASSSRQRQSTLTLA